MRRLGRSAAKADLESFAPPPSLRSAKSAPVPLSNSRRQGVDLLKQVPRSRKPHVEVQDDSDSSNENSEDGYWEYDTPAEPQPSIAHRQQRGSVYDVDRGPILHQVRTNKSHVRPGAGNAAPRAPTQSRYTRPYVEDQEESLDDKDADMSEGEAVWLSYDRSGPASSRVAAERLNRPVVPATQATRASTPRARRRRGLHTDNASED